MNNPFSQSSNNFTLKQSHIAGIVALVVFAIGILTAFKIIDTRERGIVKVVGKIQEKPLQPGVNFAIPFVSQIQTIDITNTRYEMNDVKIYTKDQQRATLDIVANYNIRPESVVKLYREIGFLDRTTVERSLMLPVLKSAITNELGQWTASEVINSKEKIAQNILINLQKEVEERNLINFTNFEIVNINLDDEYENAVRAKVVAEQKAQKSLNDTKRVEEETKQRLIEAEGEAKAMRVKSQALEQNRNLIEYEKVQVERARVEKWDGKMPTTILGNATPLINI